jgi:hypothetical protein
MYSSSWSTPETTKRTVSAPEISVPIRHGQPGMVAQPESLAFLTPGDNITGRMFQPRRSLSFTLARVEQVPKPITEQVKTENGNRDCQDDTRKRNQRVHSARDEGVRPPAMELLSKAKVAANRGSHSGQPYSVYASARPRCVLLLVLAPMCNGTGECVPIYFARW